MDTPSHASRLAAVLENERRTKGISLADLSKQTRIPRQTLERRLAGDPNLKVQEYVDIAQALGLSDYIRIWEDAIPEVA